VEELRNAIKRLDNKELQQLIRGFHVNLLQERSQGVEYVFQTLHITSPLLSDEAVTNSFDHIDKLEASDLLANAIFRLLSDVVQNFHHRSGVWREMIQLEQVKARIVTFEDNIWHCPNNVHIDHLYQWQQSGGQFVNPL
jgi:hypothetical protein